MFPRSAAQTRWHDAISDLVTHQGCCDNCRPDGAPRCAEAQRLYSLEQSAWRASRADFYVPLALAEGTP